ncbi:MAG: sulfotransferase [Verrucomicrobia bacterium]|nr:sulfotransferase [Verrucomicrobiota bacterium]
MMQMLAAGGWALKHDSDRPADADNPEGYFEWEQLKQLRTRPDILREAEGRVVKVISMLLTLLPAKHRYRVIFMRRPIEQVAESQFRMVARRRHREGIDVPVEERSVLLERLRSHLVWIEEYLRTSPNFEVLEVDYPSLVADPQDWVERIAEFAGRPELDREALARMAAVVRPALHRSR